MTQDANFYSNQTIRPIKVCIIGHTNVGKTSLMRTLLRDSSFGDTENDAATTRHVEAVNVTNNSNTPIITLYDTPGLEDATGVMDFVHKHTDTSLDGVERLEQFLSAVSANNSAITEDYTQEAKVINTLLGADVAVYVIDVREPILSKYRDELTILSSSGKPILPVFNFIKSKDTYYEEWKDVLARRSIHIASLFDTIAFDFKSEIGLWNNLFALTSATAFADLKQERILLWQEMHKKGSLIISDFIINVTSYTKKISQNTDPDPVLDEMQYSVKRAFGEMKTKLMELYKFYNVQIQTHEPLIDGSEQDIFDPELLGKYGIRTAGGSMAGLIIGAGVDVLTLGASLGLGTALGGVLGGVLPNSTTLKDKVLKVQTLNINPDTITLLATQSQILHYTLRHLGHATEHNIQLNTNIPPIWSMNKLPNCLKKARINPQLSSIGKTHDTKKSSRTELSQKLSEILDQHLTLLEKEYGGKS